MKNLLIAILLAAAAYKGYTVYSQKHYSAFDESGNPLTLLFTIENCGEPCDDVTELLDKRKVNYEEIVVRPEGAQDPRWEAFGSVKSAPYLVMGDERIVGSQMVKIAFALGAVLGDAHLEKVEKDILRKNYGADGKPKLVMYTMDGCGYCESAAGYFQEKGFHYEERNSSVDPAAARELTALRSGTPVIFYGHKVFIGWDSKVRDEVAALL